MQVMAKHTDQKPVIVGLDAVRFLAAVMVMCFHLCCWSWTDTFGVQVKILGGRAAFPELFPVTWFGWVGVEIFFVLSGIVIAYSAEGVSALAFVAKRALRLYPAAWVCATITAATVCLIGLETPLSLTREWLASVTLFPRAPWVDPVYWTLGVEMAFYALIAILLAGRKFHHLEAVAVFVGLLSSAYWIVGTIFAPDLLHDHLWGPTFRLSLVPYGCFFALGSLIYVVSRNGLSLVRVLSVVLFLSAGLIEVSYKVESVDAVFGAKQAVFVPQLLFGLAVAAMIASMRSAGPNGRGGWRLFRLLGLATYPLYLSHQIVGTAMIKVALDAGAGKYAALVLALGLCILGSVGIAVFVEPPIRGALRILATQVARVASAKTSTLRLP